MPIINVSTIQKWTGYSRQGAQKFIDRLVTLQILEVKGVDVSYGRSYYYRRYINIFGM